MWTALRPTDWLAFSIAEASKFIQRFIMKFISKFLTDPGDCDYVPDLSSYTYFPLSMSYYKLESSNPAVDWVTAKTTCPRPVATKFHLPWVNTKKRMEDFLELLG